MKTRPMTAALTPALALPLGLLLAACGTTDTGSDDKAAPKANDSAECSADETTTSTGPVTLTDSYGRTVELDKPAERVAVLEWQQVEDVLTLCLTPVAVADAEGYATWDTAEELPDGVTDVGTRGEPNLETLFGTNPDLVIVEAYTAEDEILKQLAKYDVPVLATKGADAADPVANMLGTFELIAQATGREERAQVVVDDFNAHLAEAKEKVAATDATEFVYFDGWVQGGNVSIRPFGQGSLIGELGEALGLTNAWTGEVDEAYGLGQTDIEGMSELGDATFFYTGTVDPEGDVNATLAENAVWQKIPAVAEGRSHAFPAGIWTFGGPRSAEQIIDAYVDLLTK
ncbi:iron-siderophore ABC transporter substrate-binding protein [Nocardioides carbamazepini]|jgi:ABC-type Fe3+-hydroxamate transport system substrate-binding protein|uniref:iron-siderophore ABC transporter substrate-binding protein n=1 Tax=Nocardioides carbamazepini TaxID=2854259 RepID=UPI00214A0291|nr:iron-siderophore ABC transporter substrate-binding protein [Nocardioides carbamazepini]MCR1782162.1 iron-siderophore ABC transporter substrate-binding protein [Nocardioides carbamazepini]